MNALVTTRIVAMWVRLLLRFSCEGHVCLFLFGISFCSVAFVVLLLWAFAGFYGFLLRWLLWLWAGWRLAAGWFVF